LRISNSWKAGGCLRDLLWSLSQLIDGENFMKNFLLCVVLCLGALVCYADQTDIHKGVTIYTTAEKTEYRLTRTEAKEFVPSVQPLETEICIFVNPQKTFQTFLGIGGAITDASSEVFAKLSAARQQELLDAYYNPTKGIGYSLARVSIHSSDFGSESFTYIREGDNDLKTFSIEHDRRLRIPLIKQAIATAGGNLLLYASPWSPPAFMKSNRSMLHGGKLLPEYYHAWAMYLAKFIEAYDAAGMPVWGISVQNEPMATQRWESCIFTAEEERDFLKLHLGPTLAQEGMANKKIIVWDHNRDLINQRLNVIYGDSAAAKYAWGAGFHWYETSQGGNPLYENVAAANEAYPEKSLMFTEGCAETFNPDHYQYWPNAERYGSSMIHDFNNGTVGWTDWNILLDEKGGPNHADNFCFAPVHANTGTGELIYTPAYYYIGHFSKFIRPNAKRISTVSSRSLLLSTSFANEDGSIATIVMNQSNTPVLYRLVVGTKTTAQTIPARGIQTIIY
jgi:glucosylceramidase